MPVYIFATRRDDLTRFYWNRVARDWSTDLTPGCYYPTRAGANRIYQGMAKDHSILGRRFHEIGWKWADPEPAARIKLGPWAHGGQVV